MMHLLPVYVLLSTPVLAPRIKTHPSSTVFRRLSPSIPTLPQDFPQLSDIAAKHLPFLPTHLRPRL